MTTIRMTYEEETIFMGWQKNESESFLDFWNHINDGEYRLDFPRFSKEQLEQAWLHPETIKVVGE